MGLQWYVVSADCFSVVYNICSAQHQQDSHVLRSWFISGSSAYAHCAVVPVIWLKFACSAGSPDSASSQSSHNQYFVSPSPEPATFNTQTPSPRQSFAALLQSPSPALSVLSPPAPPPPTPIFSALCPTTGETGQAPVFVGGANTPKYLKQTMFTLNVLHLVY
jgi:hypothetical protein